MDETRLTKEYEFNLLTQQIDPHLKTLHSPLSHPVIVTKLSSKKDDDDKFLVPSSLRNLIDSSSIKTKDAKQQFRCRVSVNAILPDPLEETKANDLT